MKPRRLLPADDPRRPMLTLVAELEAEIAAGTAGPLAARDVKRFRNFAGPSYLGGDELDVLRGELAQRLLSRFPTNTPSAFTNRRRTT